MTMVQVVEAQILMGPLVAKTNAPQNQLKVHWLAVTISKVAVLRRLLLCVATPALEGYCCREFRHMAGHGG